MKKLALVLFGLVVAFPVFAQDDEGEHTPLALYAGGDYVTTKALFSNTKLQSEFGGDEVDSKMYDLRVGWQMHEKIALEAHYGMGTKNVGSLHPDQYRTSGFYAVYLVPHGVLLDLIEVSAPIGFASTKLENATASETLNGASFGVNVEVPVFKTDSFGLLLGSGATAYRAQNSARVVGYHFGLRLNLKI